MQWSLLPSILLLRDEATAGAHVKLGSLGSLTGQCQFY